MNLLEEFNKEFIKRHDFYSEDLDLLASKWPKTQMKNIPEAWILPIDEMLLELSEIKIFPYCVEQKFGIMNVRYYELGREPDTTYYSNQIPDDKQFLKIQAKANGKIKLIDEDLYLFMDIDLYDIDIEYNKIYCNQIIYN